MPALSKRPAVDVNATTVLAVARLLKKAEEPVSRNWIRRQLSDAGHGTTPQRLNRAIDVLLQLGIVVEGSKGVQWTFNPDPRVRIAYALGRDA